MRADGELTDDALAAMRRTSVADEIDARGRPAPKPAPLEPVEDLTRFVYSGGIMTTAEPAVKTTLPRGDARRDPRGACGATSGSS